MLKFETLKQAAETAKEQSKVHAGIEIFVIESKGSFYTDDSSFCRNFETIHCSYVNGQKTKQKKS